MPTATTESLDLAWLSDLQPIDTRRMKAIQGKSRGHAYSRSASVVRWVLLDDALKAALVAQPPLPNI